MSQRYNENYNNANYFDKIFEKIAFTAKSALSLAFSKFYP